MLRSVIHPGMKGRFWKSLQLPAPLLTLTTKYHGLWGQVDLNGHRPLSSPRTAPSYQAFPIGSSAAALDAAVWGAV